MGYKLYASMGTADFYTEHGVEVSVFSFKNFKSVYLNIYNYNLMFEQLNLTSSINNLIVSLQLTHMIASF